MINPRTQRFRIACIIFLLVSLVISVFAWSMIATSRTEHEKQILSREDANLKFVAIFCRTGLLNNEFAETQLFVDSFGKRQNIDQIYVADSHNKIVASSSFAHLGEELQQGKLPGEFWRFRNISGEAGSLGSIAVQFNHSELAASNRALLKTALLLFPLGLLVTGVLALLLGKLLSKRIELLESAVKEVTSGNLQTHIDEQGGDEISAVATAFNVMTSSLRQTIDSIRESEERHSSIIQTAMDGFWLANEEGRLLEVNEAYCKMSGYSRQELLELSIADLDANETTEEAVKHSRRIKIQCEERFVAQHRRKDGTVFDVEVSPKALTGEDGLLVGFIRNITESKRAEEILIHERNLSMDILNAQPSGIYRIRVFAPNIWEKDAWRSSKTSPHVVELVSEHICKILGTTEEALENNPGMVIDLIYPDDREGFAKKNEEAALLLEEFIWEGRLLIDGVIRWVHFQSLPRPLENGDVLWTGALIDITDRKLAEEEKHALEQQLHQAQKMESLGVLAGGIAHDFNNILAVIMCYSSLGQQKPEKAAEFMPDIEKAAERAAGLCRQMLAYAGKTQFVESSLDMTALLDDILSMLKSSLPQNVNIKPYLSGDMPSIAGDASQLRQVVVSLFMNASEAIGEEPGDIRVSLTETTVVEGQAEKDYADQAIPTGQYLCLEVTDNGCGMDDEVKKKIFEPFYTTKFVGRGLGMSAVLGVVTSHKGALQFTSRPGHGTTFKIYLPVENGESARKEPPQQADPRAWQGSGTILLVEDELKLMDVAKTLLEMLGFSIIEASNGVEALEQYRQNAAEVRLVLTDIGMPLMNGYQLIRELKKINPMLPIIVSSGFGDSIVTSRIAPGDIAGLISKPYSFEQLREVLRGLCRGRI